MRISKGPTSVRANTLGLVISAWELILGSYDSPEALFYGGYDINGCSSFSKVTKITYLVLFFQ